MPGNPRVSFCLATKHKAPGNGGPHALEKICGAAPLAAAGPWPAFRRAEKSEQRPARRPPHKTLSWLHLVRHYVGFTVGAAQEPVRLGVAHEFSGRGIELQ